MPKKYFEIEEIDGKYHIRIDIHLLYFMVRNLTEMEHSLKNVRREIGLLTKKYRGHHDMLMQLADVVNGKIPKGEN